MKHFIWKLFGISFEEDFDVEWKFIKEHPDNDESQMKRNQGNDIKEREDSENNKLNISVNRNFDVSDIVCDMHLVISMRNLIMSEDFPMDTKKIYVSNLAYINELLIEYIRMAKNVISEIGRRRRCLGKYNMLNPYFIWGLHEYIREIREVINNRIAYEERRIHADELLKSLNEEESIFQNVEQALKNLEYRVGLYGQASKIPELQKRRRIGVYFAIRNIPEALGPRYKESSELMKFMNRFYRYHPNRNDDMTTQMIINAAEFDKHISYIVDNTVKDMCTMQENVCKNPPTNIDSFLTEIAEMRNYINKTRDDFGHYKGKKTGCFALMDLKHSINKNKQIFAFSSMFDCDDNDIKSYFGITDADTKKGLRKNLIYMQSEILKGSEWAKTVKEMKRYFSHSNRNIRLKTAETIEEVIQNNNGANDDQKKDIRSDFNCCERKMIPQVYINVKGNINECNLFTRHSVCSKCEPEIEDFIKCKKIGSIHSYYIENNELIDKIIK